MSAPPRKPALTPRLAKAPTGTHPLAPKPHEGPPTPKQTVMVSARIDVDLRQAVRIYSAESGISVQEIVTEALTEYLARNKWQPPARQHVSK